MALAWLGLGAVRSADSGPETVRQHFALHAGYTRSSFRGVNLNDASVALRIFAQTTALKRGYDMEVDVQFFESPAACEAAIRKGAINLAILDAWDFLDMNIRPLMEPVVVHMDQGSVYKNYLLVTRKGGGMTNLAMLRGADLLVLEGKGGNISRAWLDHLLSAGQLGTKETFFRTLVPVIKPTEAVLPVFFGSRPACLVDRGAFQLMVELNPQIGQTLVILAVSDPYLESVTCMSHSGWPSERTRRDLIKAMLELEHEPSGRQILELFKVDRLVPFQENYLDTVQQLRTGMESPAKPNRAPLMVDEPEGNHAP